MLNLYSNPNQRNKKINLYLRKKNYNCKISPMTMTSILTANLEMFWKKLIALKNQRNIERLKNSNTKGISTWSNQLLNPQDHPKLPTSKLRTTLERNLQNKIKNRIIRRSLSLTSCIIKALSKAAQMLDRIWTFLWETTSWISMRLLVTLCTPKKTMLEKTSKYSISKKLRFWGRFKILMWKSLILKRIIMRRKRLMKIWTIKLPKNWPLTPNKNKQYSLNKINKILKIFKLLKMNSVKKFPSTMIANIYPRAKFKALKRSRNRINSKNPPLISS